MLASHRQSAVTVDTYQPAELYPVCLFAGGDNGTENDTLVFTLQQKCYKDASGVVRNDKGRVGRVAFP